MSKPITLEDVAFNARVACVSAIVENPVALRSVNRDSEEFHNLCDSISEKGLLNALLVREKKLSPDEEQPIDPSTGAVTTQYLLIDGLQRFTALKTIGKSHCAVHVVSMTDAEALVVQMHANMQRIETKPAEYAKHMLRLLGDDNMLTERDLARQLCKTPEWVAARLSINKITDERTLRLINEEAICLLNAYALAKLAKVAPKEVSDWIDRAQTLPAAEFGPQINARIKEIREHNRTGTDPGDHEFAPVPMLRRLKEFKEELDTNAQATAMANASGLSGDALLGYTRGVRDGIAWGAFMDTRSQQQQQAKDVERRALREEARKKAAAAKAVRAEAIAADKAKKAAADAEAAKAGMSDEEIAAAVASSVAAAANA